MCLCVPCDLLHDKHTANGMAAVSSYSRKVGKEATMRK